MFTYVLYRSIFHTYKSCQQTRTFITPLWEYTNSQWTNATLTLWPHFHLQQQHTFPLISQITEAYNYGSSIQIDDLTFTLSIPHKLQLDQPNTIIEAQILQFQAAPKHLTNLLKQEPQRYHHRIPHSLHPWLPFRQATRISTQHFPTSSIVLLSLTVQV